MKRSEWLGWASRLLRAVRGEGSRRPRKGASRLCLEPLEDRALLNAGGLDPTFGTGGLVNVNVPGTLWSQTRAVVVQPDHKIVVVGIATRAVAMPGGRGYPEYFNSSSFVVARFNPDGSLDSTFGTGGLVSTQVSTSDNPAAVAVEPDGKILVMGSTFTMDPLFGVYWVFPPTPTTVLIRYNTDGTLDSTFGTGGIVQTDANGARGLAVQPDGKILLAGSQMGTGTLNDFLVERYTATGSLDASFGNGGKVTTDFRGGNDDAKTVLLQPDGKITVVGTVTSPPVFIYPFLTLVTPGSRDVLTSPSVGIVRYNPDGSLDSSFGQGGKVDEGGLPIGSVTVAGAALLPDGRIVVAGDDGIGDGVLLRFNSDGTPDATFGNGGLVARSPNDSLVYQGTSSLIVQADGRIVVAGFSRYGVFTYGGIPVLTRYNPDGTIDDSFGRSGRVSEDYLTALALQPDGRIVAVSDSSFTVARLLGDDWASTFTTAPDKSLWAKTPYGNWIELSPAGSILAISASTDATGAAEVFALGIDYSLWVRTRSRWTMLSPPGTINSVSAEPGDVAFAVASTHALWMHTAAGWTMLSPAILTASAGIDSSGHAEVSVIASDHSLWRYDQGAWTLLSPAGTINAVSAIGDVVYAIASDASLWEHTQTGWSRLSPGGTILAISAGTDVTGAAEVFALASDHSLWVNSHSQWSLLSPGGTIRTLLGSQDDAVFVVAADDSLWEHQTSGWARLALPTRPRYRLAARNG
jgi:uncharacterized delta-60 repeat protein